MTADRPPAREGQGDERREALVRAVHQGFHQGWRGPSQPLDLYADSAIWPALADALAPLLAEWSAQDRAAAWDEGYGTGADDECFHQRGLSTDRDADEYPHANPYRADEIGPRA